MKSIPDFENDNSLSEKQKARRRYYYSNRRKSIDQTAQWTTNNKEKMEEWRKGYREKNREKQRQYVRNWCKVNHELHKNNGREWYRKNREIVSIKTRAKFKLLKREVMDAYGGFCSCCGENMIEFLSIDHVNNDGAKHRRESSNGVGSNLYRLLKRNHYPAGYQVLCYNCNMAKAMYGICPHCILTSEFIGVKIKKLTPRTRYRGFGAPHGLGAEI